MALNPSLRRKGSAELLVQEIVSQAEKVNYLSLAAHVATDLADANRFWQRMGFETLRTRPGGKTTARTINVRVRNLNTPTLFDFVERESVHVRKRDLMLHPGGSQLNRECLPTARAPAGPRWSHLHDYESS